jgi:hypothetical protein
MHNVDALNVQLLSVGMWARGAMASTAGVVPAIDVVS